MHSLAVIVNLVFPGIGLVLVGRRMAGIAFAVAFCAAVDGILLSPLVIPGKPAASFAQAFAVAAGGIWVWSLATLGRRIRFLRSPVFLELKEKMFREGLDQYLKDRLREARDTFQKLLALDSEDADACFYMGLIHKHLGQAGPARAYLRRCAHVDYGRKWRWEVEEHLNLLKGERA